VIRGIIFDLDGTVYRGDDAVPGAAGFVRRLPAWGVRPLFLTNRANRPREEVGRQLRGLGIPCDDADVMTTAEATAAYLRREGVRAVYCVGERGIRLALAAEGIALVEERPDCVVVSLDREFTYAKMQAASRLILAGARCVATNPDRRLSLPEGVVPGAGAILAAITTTTSVEPLIIGKPNRVIMDHALERMGLPAAEVVALGDNLETDIPAGHRAGMRTVLMLTGVSTRDEARTAAIQPTWIAEDFADLTRWVEARIG
jgi:4-nitrophenyl phosphatase